ncbi:hypothetical protein IAQ61_010662, partial [Plenodomus lingam]|uniref:uncharacterized protein n=1 Tax=Leptosphaeria maculans TaxID=5022 RepID=UPI00332A33F9
PPRHADFPFVPFFISSPRDAYNVKHPRLTLHQKPHRLDIAPLSGAKVACHRLRIQWHSGVYRPSTHSPNATAHSYPRQSLILDVHRRSCMCRVPAEMALHHRHWWTQHPVLHDHIIARGCEASNLVQNTTARPFSVGPLSYVPVVEA